MLGMDRGYVIKHKWHHEGLSIRQIAGDLEVSRNTVRKYLYAEGEPRRRESDKRAQPVLDEVRERIDEILQEWGRRTTPKQRITGTLVHEQLQREGHQVGSTTVAPIWPSSGARVRRCTCRWCGAPGTARRWTSSR